MAKREILLPTMGEGIIEATVTQILVKKGASVEEDDSIMEVATDKVDSEIPAPEDGVVTDILVEEGQVVKVGAVIAILQTEGEDEEDDSVENEVSEETPKASEKVPFTQNIASVSEDIINSTSSFLSPLVRSIIKEENISEDEIKQIKGTGLEGRITKNDMLEYLKTRNVTTTAEKETPQQLVTAPATAPAPKPESKPVQASGSDEIVEMDRMRRLIADHMVDSVRVSPHVTSFVEVDMTKIVKWRNQQKEAFLKRQGEKLTFTPIFVEAMAKAVRDYPMINVSVGDGQIIVKKNVNIGMAAALPSGNLIVPVIKNADQKNLIGLAKDVNDLAQRSRTNKLNPDEITGSTITITNLGTFGNITGTPIINQPNVAILAVGSIDKKPAVIETPEGDTIGIRHKMIIALSYDHRVVDGALGGLFLKRVGEYLENFDDSVQY